MKLAGGAKQKEGHCFSQMCYQIAEMLRTGCREQWNPTLVPGETGWIQAGQEVPPEPTNTLRSTSGLGCCWAANCSCFWLLARKYIEQGGPLVW